MTGPNGLTEVQNLAARRKQPLFEKRAELEHSKCASHPTKRMWTDPMEAIREAEARTVAAKMPIAAYRCDSCGGAHLCKRSSVREGSLLERPEVELPLVLGDADARRKVLKGFLADRDSVTTDEVAEVLQLQRVAVGRYMSELKWHNTRGRHARWIPSDTPVVEVGAPANFEVFKGKGMTKGNLHALDATVARHPASRDTGWRPMRTLDRVRHMPIGDLLDTLEAAGLEVRLQVRES